MADITNLTRRLIDDSDPEYRPFLKQYGEDNPDFFKAIRAIVFEAYCQAINDERRRLN